MELNKTYDPKSAENHWYKWWMENGFFRSVPDGREPYTIVIPPPNVTGVLHMGHMLNNTIQDVLVRRARMLGKNACWVPGTDHASIATEAKVVALLKEKGIDKRSLSREDFLKHAWDWKEKYGGIILEQLKKLGASCDWERTRFTMEEELSGSVIDVFIDLYKKGYIYRGTRMVNWDVAALTAVSDEEVFMKEAMSKLFYVKYQIEGTNEFVTIATTRPETILGDTAVCVHPDDPRYTHLKGKRVIVPMVNRSVPVIFDEYVDKEFGTGALKVTPAHDKNDYELGKKHQLESIDVLNPNGTMSTAAQLYIGLDRFACRKQIVIDLEAKGHLVKTEEIKNNVGYSERTNVVIEPRLSMQWYVSMKKISQPALENVVNGNVQLIPEKFINTYKYWMENVQDWCISRQLWWGQRIPAWYDMDGNFVVAKTAEEAIKQFQVVHHKSYIVSDLRQDEDVVDTWFSSWLWPISVFDPKVFANGKEKANADLKYYYPTNDLVTAPEILFFWVARMIIAGYEYMGDKPFSNVYLTGIVRDKQGRKMSKSLGNSPDPLDLIDKYGADGVRVGMLLCSPAGNDLPFDESLCEQGRNFANKIWNAFRLIKSWQTDLILPQNDNAAIVERFNAVLLEKLEEIDNHYSSFRLSDALLSTYKLVWDDFCAIYLEQIKPSRKIGENFVIDQPTYNATLHFFEVILKLLHPFMPFIAEELWDKVKPRAERDRVIIAKWPKASELSLDNYYILKSLIELRPRKSIYSDGTFMLSHDNIEYETSIDQIKKDWISIKKGISEISRLRKKLRISDHFVLTIICLAEYKSVASLLFYKKEIKKLGNCELIVQPELGLTNKGTSFSFIRTKGIDWYVNNNILATFNQAQEIIQKIRTIRNQARIPGINKLKLHVQLANEIDKIWYDKTYDNEIKRFGNLSEINFHYSGSDFSLGNCFPFVVGSYEYLLEIGESFDLEKRKAELLKELEYNQGFLSSVKNKLANEKFVANAKPELVENEKKKLADAEAKIKALQQQLASL